MQKGVDAKKVFGRQEGKDPHTYFEPQHLLGLFRFRLHHTHRSELGVLLGLIQIKSCTHGVERMEYLQRLLDKFDRFELLIAGLIGAVVASWWHKDDLSDWRAWLVFLITGVACSLYLTSMVSTYLNVTEPKIVAGIGFLLGTFGGSLLAAINRAIKAADLWALIRQRFGGGNPP